MGVQVIRSTEDGDLETITDSSENVMDVNTDVTTPELREATNKDNEKHPS